MFAKETLRVRTSLQQKATWEDILHMKHETTIIILHNFNLTQTTHAHMHNMPCFGQERGKDLQLQMAPIAAISAEYGVK